MARLERKSMTRWENGVAKTYRQGDDVPDLKPSGLSGVMLTQEEGGGVRKKAAGKTAPAPAAKTETATSDSDSDLDIIDRLEGNAESVKAWVLTVDRIDILEEILVAEGEGKNRSTVRGAIEDRIKVLEEGEEG